MEKNHWKRYFKKIILGFMLTLAISFIWKNDFAEAAKKRIRLHLEPEQITWVYGRDDRRNVVLTDNRRMIVDGVRFYSEDPSVIDINEAGRLVIDNRKQKETGSTRIVAVYQGKKYVCRFKKVNPSMKKEKVVLTLGKKNHEREKLEIKGIDGVDGKPLPCRWYSDQPSVVKITKKGKITGKQEGKAVITCTVDAQKQYTCTVQVKKVQVKAVTLDQASLSMKKEDTRELVAALLPENVSDPSVEWSSENTKVAKVSASGKVTAVGPGDTVVTVKSKDNPYYQAECKVHVEFDSKDVTLSRTELTLGWTSKSITLTDKTGNLESKDVTWRVDDPSVISLDEEVKDGYQNTVTAKKKGTTKVYAVVKAPDGNTYEYGCTVKVEINNYGLEGKVSRFKEDGTDELTLDGILSVTLANHGDSAYALRRLEDDEAYTPVLSMGGYEYKMYVRSVEENEKKFRYGDRTDICVLGKGESVTLSYIAQEEEIQKLRKGSYDFRSAGFIFYLYDEAGNRHQIRISGADEEGNVLETRTEDDLNTTGGLYVWKVGS